MGSIVIFLKERATWFWLAALAVALCQIMLCSYVCGIYKMPIHISIISNLLGYAAILAPYFFVKPSWRRFIWIPFAILSIFLFSQSVYFRAFKIFYGPNDINIGALATGIVIKSTFALIRLSDIVILLMPICLIPLYYLWRKDILCKSYAKWIRVFSFLSIFFLPSLVCAWSIYRSFCWKKTIYKDLKVTIDNIDLITREILSTELHNSMTDNGIIFLLIQMASESFINMNIPEAELENYVHKALHGHDLSGVMLENKNKNLIFIVVESWNSPTLDFKDARHIMPTVVELAEDTTSIIVRKVASQAGFGRSATGQFIYNTGLYPVDNILMINYFAHGNYPSIAKALDGYYSFEIIGEPARVWHHDITTKSYGFDNLYSLNMTKINELDEDGMILSYAEQIIDTVPEPFFAFITTLSSHDPYIKPAVTSRVDSVVIKNNNLTALEANYLADMKHFDESLAKFLAHLRKKGILDNSILVITGDHIVNPVSLSSSTFVSEYVPLIIYGAERGLRYDGVVGQVDVFPTILDVLGVSNYTMPQNNAPYHGMGRSILSGNPPKSARGAGGKILPESVACDELADSLNSVYHAGEKLIRSGYFAY